MACERLSLQSVCAALRGQTPPAPLLLPPAQEEGSSPESANLDTQSFQKQKTTERLDCPCSCKKSSSKFGSRKQTGASVAASLPTFSSTPASLA